MLCPVDVARNVTSHVFPAHLPIPETEPPMLPGKKHGGQVGGLWLKSVAIPDPWNHESGTSWASGPPHRRDPDSSAFGQAQAGRAQRQAE